MSGAEIAFDWLRLAGWGRHERDEMIDVWVAPAGTDPILSGSTAPQRSTALPIRRCRASIGPESRDAMRPSLLNPFFALVTTLPGVGSRLEKLYRRLFGREQEARVVDLLFHLPTGAIDRRARPKLRDVVPDTVVTVAVTVDRHRPPPQRPRAPYQIYTGDET